MTHATGPDRFFFALWPPAPVRQALRSAASHWLREVEGACRPTPADRYHLTLLYLGRIEEAQARFLADDPETGRVMPGDALAWEIDRFGHFSARVAWAGSRDTPPVLLELHQRLVRRAAEVGIALADKKSFVPHITVARDVRNRWPEPQVLDTPIRWTVRECLLVRSIPAQRYAYRPVARFSFGSSREE